MQIQDLTIVQKLMTHKNELLRVHDFYSLQLLLKAGGRELEFHINKPIYYSFEIPKKKNGTRKIQAPNVNLAALQRQLNFYLQAVYLIIKPKEVHGFIIKPKGFEVNHSIISNAAIHTNKKHVLNIDLKDFFPSISARRIREIMEKHVGIQHTAIADALALLCTYKKMLPTGAPTSPVLSNFACIEMDNELINFCAQHDISYTRYADDLSFSANHYFSSDEIKLIRTIITKYHFTINEKKFRLLSSQSKQMVTGIIVNKKLNVDRTYIRNIRAVLHHIKTDGIEEAAMKHYKVSVADQFLQQKLLFKVKGQIDFVGQVRGREDGIYLKMILMMNTQKQVE
jgi:RNA-directed DNA polymerase